MGFTKITSEDTANKGVVGLADTPNLSTQEMQAKFDELATDVIIPKFNELSTELDDKNIDERFDERVVSEDISNIRLNRDNQLETSKDGGETWETTASSGHIIENGAGTMYPSRARLQFSDNVIVMDDLVENKTFISIPAGEKGDKGESATIRVGNVEAGDSVKFENVGSDTDAIFDVTIPKGDKGDAATVRIGSVQTGDNPSVYNSGTTSNAIFNFVLPKGEKGDDGTSFQVLGLYATYADLIAAHPVGRRGEAYAVGDETFNEVYNWNTSTLQWDNLGALKGAKGDTGLAATVTVGTVTQGNTTSVENVGTSENAVFNFVLEKGEKGDTGNAATIAIGSVEAGDYPEVTNVGTDTNAVFDFKLQRGPQGPQGTPTTVNGKTAASIELDTRDLLMTGYVKEAEGDIATTDTLAVALSKLETRKSGGSIIKVTVDEELVGENITCANGEETYTKVATALTEFNVEGIGEWTITCGESEATVEISYFGIYETEIKARGAYNYQSWLDSASITKTFASLEEVLADEVTLRTLFTKHASVDYLVEWSENDQDTVDDILEHDLVAKWVNLRDYAFDTLYNGLHTKPIMVQCGKYGYGEWVLKDGVWGAKGLVPIMTSNSVPYGEASESSEYQYSGIDFKAHNAFDGSASTTFASLRSSTRKSDWIQYKSVNPICVKKIRFGDNHVDSGLTFLESTFTLKGSNSGADNDWHDIATVTKPSGYTVDEFEVNSDTYYMYHRLVNNQSNVKTGSYYYTQIRELQFYGRQLTVSVPKMDSNTSPWGEAFASNEYNPAWKAFDQLAGTTSASDDWNPFGTNTQDATAWIAYDFKTPTVVKYFDYYVFPFGSENNPRAHKITILGSNDKALGWVELYTKSDINTTGHTVDVIQNNIPYRYYKLYIEGANKVWRTTYSINVALLNFYALDYSEHTERHWIYDHGVELEEISGNSLVKSSDSARSDATSSVNAIIRSKNAIDFTPYKLARLNLTTKGDSTGIHAENPSGTSLGYTMVLTNQPYNVYNSVENVNESARIRAEGGGVGNYIILREMWLE